MHQVVSLYRSSVGKKILMALSGVILFMFIVLHMLGNLKVLTGPETQGQPERDQRVLDMVAVHDEERFGSCHQPRCLSGGVPDGDQRRLHCPSQPGSAQGRDEGTAPPGGRWARGGLAVGHGDVVHA